MLIAGLGGLAASAFSFAMAVYESAHPPAVPQASVGKPIDTGRWLVTVRSAIAGKVPPTGRAPFQPKQFVMVELDVENRSATPDNVLDRVVKLGLPGVQLPTTYLDRDKSIAGFFNPGMPERVTMTWELPPAALLPDRITLTVNGQIYKLRDNLYGASGWYERDAVATVNLPLEKRP